MNGIELHDVLAVARWPAQDRLALLMDRVKPVDLTSQQILALVAVFESADQRVNAPATWDYRFTRQAGHARFSAASSPWNCLLRSAYGFARDGGALGSAALRHRSEPA
jgi:hypothetical protein